MRYDEARACITMSVGELCAYALSCGDLDLRPGMSRKYSPARAAVGAAVHRKLQREAGVGYQSEVSMTHTELFGDLSFEVSGRADGVIEVEPLTVDEIKTVSGRAFDLPPAPMHDAQVKCYAYFLCSARGLKSIQTRLTYYRTDDGKIKHALTQHSYSDLKEFYHSLLARVAYRAQILRERQTILLPATAASGFPFCSVRQGQDMLIKECYRDIRAGKRLFAEAPTGIGKTVSTIYPALRALGEGHCDKIFYLTAKAATRREAYGAAEKLFEAGARHRTAVLTAREQICSNEMAKQDDAGISRHCNPFDCPRAKGFYDRVPSAVCELLSRQSGYSRAVIEETAARYQLCPYELQLELSEFCDLVICDYNYVFDPQVYLRRYFASDGENGRYVFLVDEAHNLPDRARGMYSARLKNTDLSTVFSALPEDLPLRLELEKLAVTMQGFRRLCSDTLQKDDLGVEHGYDLRHGAMESFHELVRALRPQLDAWLRSHPGDENETAVYLLSAKLKRFELIADTYDESFVTFLEVEGEEREIRLICLDPSHVLDTCLNRAHAAVLFSATLTPPSYYSDILGGGRDAVRVSLPSPFDEKNFFLCAVTGVNTRYEEREKSYKKIISVIAATVSAKSGNYIVYFPSYDYMEQVLERFEKKYPDVTVVAQKRGMSAVEREQFLDSFADDARLRVGFCVLGGSFSEGVDLPGRRLIGTVIVGTGLPGLSNERNILRDHYENTRERGYDYAYVYPGMNRVLQAAGRVIRREDDCGVVVLVDDRYSEERIKSILPQHWGHLLYAGNATELAFLTREFWDKLKKS